MVGLQTSATSGQDDARAPSVEGWFPFRRVRPNAQVRLLCLGYAGASAVLYKDWPEVFPDTLDVCPVQLPGRGARAGEPHYVSVEDAVEDLADALGELPPLPLALYGHSLGGLLAFELARALTRLGEPPVHLFPVASPAPHRPLGRAPVHDGPEEALIDYLREMGGTPDAVLEQRWLRGMFLPTLRADLQMFETYVHGRDAALPCPITALGGAEDPHVSATDLQAWREHTVGPFELRMYPGGHFFVDDDPAGVQALVYTALGLA